MNQNFEPWSANPGKSAATRASSAKKTGNKPAGGTT
jgi:hypothetical protein